MNHLHYKCATYMLLYHLLHLVWSCLKFYNSYSYRVSYDYDLLFVMMRIGAINIVTNSCIPVHHSTQEDIDPNSTLKALCLSKQTWDNQTAA